MNPFRSLLRPCAATLLAAFVVGSAAPSAGRRPNHLLGQTSPYLLEHVQNPVDWYPWGDEAIGRARREGKPIFLSIGYSACHWCHVMAREVFEDEEIARILNDRFVSIKVDREERPDLDAVYMAAVVAMTGGGGWPMSVFLTPDLKPFYGGTYFPRDAFRERLLAIASAWDTHRREALDAADGIQRLLVEQQRPPDPAGRAAPADLLLRESARELALAFDRANGGFGGRPKFPPHGALWLLLREHARSRDAGALDMVVRTLDGMARGGLYDQIGGGFHRYATDERWLQPHFEKMLYDNALLAPIYLETWKVTGHSRFRRVAEETLAWAMREMADPGGGFCASLDADSEGREGAFYLWTANEVKAIVGPADSDLVIAYYGLADGGRFEGGGTLPHVARSIEEVVRERGLPEDAARARLESARRKLMGARSRRVPPRRDGKILTAWNGLMISALARAYESTGAERYRAAAIGAADFLRLHVAGPDGRLRVSWTDGRPGPPGHLDDSAFLARGLLDLHDATGEGRFLDQAALILGSASRFYDARDGGYFFAEGGRPDLIVRTRSLDDGPLPSGSAVMVDDLARLSRALGDPSLLEPAARTLALAAPALRRSPLASPYMVLAALRMGGEGAGTPSPPPARIAMAPGSLRDAPVLAADRTGEAPPAAAPGTADAVHAGTAGTGEPPERLIQGSVVGRAGPQRVVESSILAPAGAVRPDQAVTLSVRLRIDRGWHVNSSRPTLSYLIPTRIEFPAPAAANVEEIAYPEGTLVSLKFADEKLSVYQGDTTIRATISPPAGAPAGGLAVKARLTYQACSDLACLAPETVEFAIPIRVEGEPVTRAPAPPGGSGAATAAPGGPASPAGGGIGALLGSGGKGGEGIKTLLEERGLLMLLGVVFLAGLALNLTPCVYPMIPVTIGFFVNQASGSWRRRIGLPALYVLGMAVTYSILGVAAGLTGSLFGSLLQSPWVTGLLVSIFVVMALSMFGLFEIRMPAWLTRYSGGRRGAAGAFLMGLTMGIAAAPCIGPFIVPLLAFVGASGRPVLGFWLFFVMAIGMGLPNLLLGTFSGALAGLPRSGSWLLFAKKVMGVALLAVALYFLQPFLSDRRLGWIVLGFAGVSGVYLALLERTRIASAWFRPVKIAAGVATMVIGAWIALPLLGVRPEPAWRPYSPEALERAKAGGRPVIIDFFASWCLPCKELDRFTFTDPRVIDEAGRFVMLKADLSQFESQPVRDVRERFSVLGVPTVILIDGTGSERRDLRVYGFEDGAVFLGRMRRVR